MQKRISEGLHYLIGASVILCLLMFFLAEHGRANAFATYLVALGMLAALANPQTWHELMLAPRAILISTICLLEYLAISAWWSESGNLELVLKYQGYAALILLFLFALIVSIHKYQLFLFYLVGLTLAAAAISAGYSIYLHFALPEYQPLPEPRLYGLGRLSNPVISAASYGFAVMLGLWLLVQSDSKVRQVLIGLVVAILCFAIVLSGTRTVWLAMAIGAGVGIALTTNRQSWLMFLGITMAIGAIGLIAVGWEDVVKRGLSFRPEIWAEFIDRSIAANPLLGAGSGANSHWVTEVLTFKHPHSVFVSTFYFGGITGLGLLIALLYFCTRLLLAAKVSSIRTLALITLAYGTVFALFDGDSILTKIDYLWWLIWLPVGLCLSLQADGAN